MPSVGSFPVAGTEISTEESKGFDEQMTSSGTATALLITGRRMCPYGLCEVLSYVVDTV